jgi:hypothetical protein
VLIIENSRIHDINRTAYASVAIYGNVNKLKITVLAQAALFVHSLVHERQQPFSYRRNG